MFSGRSSQRGGPDQPMRTPELSAFVPKCTQSGNRGSPPASAHVDYGKPRAPPSTPFLARVGPAHRHVVAIPAPGEVVAVDL